YSVCFDEEAANEYAVKSTMIEQNTKQADTWNRLFDGVSAVLAEYGAEYFKKSGDFLLNEDNYGWPRIMVSVQNLKMLAPDIIARLRDLLVDLPGWEIAVAVDLPGKERIWPIMGLTIRKDEIIDGLQRQYFPPEFQGLRYAGSRPGSVRD
ncbi:MAG: hypothetical protein B7Y77_01215, partial [Bradyrhizobium sp. 35-63-5]